MSMLAWFALYIWMSATLVAAYKLDLGSSHGYVLFTGQTQWRPTSLAVFPQHNACMFSNFAFQGSITANNRHKEGECMPTSFQTFRNQGCTGAVCYGITRCTCSLGVEVSLTYAAELYFYVTSACGGNGLHLLLGATTCQHNMPSGWHAVVLVYMCHFHQMPHSPWII
jgi:hypothetical protein